MTPSHEAFFPSRWTAAKPTATPTPPSAAAGAAAAAAAATAVLGPGLRGAGRGAEDAKGSRVRRSAAKKGGAGGPRPAGARQAAADGKGVGGGAGGAAAGAAAGCSWKVIDYVEIPHKR